MGRLRLKNIFKKYETAKEGDFAVNDLTLECEPGEFIGILGPSGCGKTTTLRMIAGLEDITRGEILLDDTVINDLHPKDRNIGLAFEDYALYPPLNVYDNIAFNLRAKKVAESEIKTRISKIAKLLNVDEILDMKPVNLSGGQKQRVNITRAIIRNPELLLLDEPLSHLDGKMRQSMRGEIKRLQKKINCTTIIVTHDQLEAMSMADRIAIMDDGKLQQFGTPMDVYNNPVNEFIASFIGEPPMNLLTTTVVNKDGKLYFSFSRKDLLIPVPENYQSVLQDDNKYRLGIRPNDIIILAEGETAEVDSAEAVVEVYENLGDERRVHLKLGDGDEDYITIITDIRKRFEPGEKIRFYLSAERTHVFDMQTRNRINT